MGAAGKQKGVYAALASAFFLGVVPIFGKVAINSGFSPLAVIVLRTGIAALLMLAVMAIAKRQYFYIFPVGLVGCLLAGLINGLGSILYYTALGRMEASVGHMLYSFYPLFVAVWLLLDRQPMTRLTIFRLILSVPAVILLIYTGKQAVDPVGALMMIGSAVLYALHLIINQRVLYEVPAPTVTLYTLLGMTVTVLIGYLVVSPQIPTTQVAWWAVIAMALITFFSRFTLFMGIKHLGGLQTALLGLAEIFITIFFAVVALGESLSIPQILGAALLAVSLVLVGLDKIPPQKRHTTGWLSWLNPPKIPAADMNWNP
jgi:drug/metabolite transporter (DMT)-like permease